MATLLLRLVGPMQSWGTTSRFDHRDTGKEPSKSGVLGILAAAMGIDRSDWETLEPLTNLALGVRHDRSGVPKYDYQTAGAASSDTIIRADGTQSKDGVVSFRHYLADAAFLVGLEGKDQELLRAIQAALQNPVWPLFLGRRSYVSSEPIWIEKGLRNEPLGAALKNFPWVSTQRRPEELPARLLVSMESQDGSGTLKMDQLLSSFAQRKFGSRFVYSEYIPFPQREAAHVSA